MNNERLHKYLTYLDGRSSANEYEAIAFLEASGIDVPGLLLKRYKISRRWSDRESCLRHSMKYAKTNEDAYQIGIMALRDRSKVVRNRACKLLSFAQKKAAIEYLEILLTDPASRDDALTAIEELNNLDHD